ncbi:MAG: diguanylate cyclase [Pseudomonadota bacterium]
MDPKLEFFQYVFDFPPESINMPSEVSDVVEDQDGFLWLATARGLIRFDGLEAKAYRLSEHSGLLSNYPTRLFVDSANRLFVASERGTSVFDGRSFVPLLVGSRTTSQAQAFAEASDGAVWIGTDEGLARVAPDANIASRVDGSPMHTRSLLWHQDRLYVGGRGTLAMAENDAFVKIDVPPRYAEANVLDLELHQGQVWGATGAGLLHLSEAGAHAVVREELQGLSFDVLLSDRDENLWFAGRGIFGRFYPDGGIELPDVVDETLGYSPEISKLLEDSSGRQWHASRFFGIGSFTDTPIERMSYTEGLPSTNVTALAHGPDATIIVATDQGISAVADTGAVTLVSEDFASGNLVLSMLLDDAGQLWLGTERELRSLRFAEGSWTDTGTSYSIGAAVNAIEPIDSGFVVATDAGLFSITAEELEPVPDAEGMAIDSLLYDSSGTLWIGTEAGLGRMTAGQIADDDGARWRPLGTVVGIAELQTGQLAAATADQGIFIGSAGNWHQFGEADGLPPEQIIAIEADAEHLWIITAGGVFRATVSADQEPQLSVEPVAGHPLYRPTYVTNCCRGRNGAAALIAQGTLAIASDDGVITFDSDIPTRAAPLPRPYVKSVVNAGATYPVDTRAPIAIDSRERDVQIDYSAIQLAYSGQVRFRYRLSGLSETWVDAGQDRSAHFLNLPPGDYQFELQASHQPGTWFSAAPVALERHPTLLETTAFRVLMWLTAILVGLALIWFWLQAARIRHERLEAKIRARTAELEAVNKDLLAATETDPLTGLTNRRFLSENRRKEALDGRAPLAGLLAIIDIDRFKRVNDEYGHRAGDDVLRELANNLQSLVGPRDVVARWGGDEFLVICRCPNDDAVSMLNKICSSVKEHAYRISEVTRATLTCSVGGACYPLHAGDSLADTFGSLLEIADAALYAVKTNGRDGWAFVECEAAVAVAAPRKPIALDFGSPSIGRFLQALIEGGELTWLASRKEISLAMANTVTRLPTQGSTPTESP